MARRRGPTNYQQVITQTAGLGVAGEQIHVCEINKLDPALRGSFLKNIRYSIQYNDADDQVANEFIMPSFTVYLSYEASTWSDNSVIAASATAQGGGNGNLTANRYINTDQTGSEVAMQLGPLHVWIEATDMPLSGDPPNNTARLTLAIWGRMIKVTPTF